MTAIDLSADVGLVAVFLATINLCLGLLIAARYSPWRCWPHRRFNIFAVHNCTAYVLVASIALHPMILLFSTVTHWRLPDVVLPLWSPVQPVENTVGAASMYLVLVVVLTSYFRHRLGRQRWKRFHYWVYAAGICAFIHGILIDPKLKGNPIDPFDGEKLLVESCLLVVVLTAIWAWRSRLRRDRHERRFAIGRYRALQNGDAGVMPEAYSLNREFPRGE